MRTRGIPGRRRLAVVLAALAVAAIPSPVLGADTVAPTTTAPKTTFRWDVTGDLSGATPRLRIRISWTGSDDAGGAGIATYQLSRSLDGGTTWASISKTLTSTAVTSTIAVPVEGVELLRSIRFRVRAVDKAGNVGLWATGPNLRPRIIDDRNPALTYTGDWTNCEPCYGVQDAFKIGTSGSVSYTFTGRAAVVLHSMYPTRTAFGTAEFFADGKLIRTVTLFPGPYSQQGFQLWAVSWSKAGTHTIKIVLTNAYFFFDGLALTDNAWNPLSGPGPDTDTAAQPRAAGPASGGGPGTTGWLVVLLALVASRQAVGRRAMAPTRR